MSTTKGGKSTRMWLKDHGFQKYLIGKALGYTHHSRVKKLVVHVTEGSTALGAISWYKHKKSIHPHFTVDPFKKTKYQHVGTDRASYALRKLDQSGVLQLEIAGWSGYKIPRRVPKNLRVENWTDEIYDWLRTEVISPILAACPSITRTTEWWKGHRLSDEEWEKAHGIVGHMHAPHNNHSDPGPHFKYVRLLYPAPPPAVPEIIIQSPENETFEVTVRSKSGKHTIKDATTLSAKGAMKMSGDTDKKERIWEPAIDRLTVKPR